MPLEEALLSTKSSVQDRGWLVFVTFIALGVASLLPWNVIVTETDYFLVRSHVQPAVQAFANNFPSILANCYSVMNMLGFMLLVPAGKYIAVHYQITLPGCAILATLASQAWLAGQLGLSGNAEMAVTVTGGVVLGLASSVLICGAYLLASKFPPIYVQAVVAGQALAGLLVSLLSLLTTWLNPPQSHMAPTPADVRSAAVAYFTGSAGVMAAALLGYLALPHLRFAQQHTLLAAGSASKEEAFAASQEAYSCQPDAARSIVDLEAIASRVRRHLRRSSSSLAAQQAAGECEAGASPQQLPTLAELLSHLRGLHWVVVLTFGTTYFVFPAVTSRICSVHNAATAAPCHAASSAGRVYGDLFVPISFVLYNGGDFVGRFAAGLHSSVPATPVLLGYAVTRWLLVAALMLCNVVMPHAWVVPEFFRADMFPIAFVTLLGLTNGHLASMTLMHVPTLQPQIVRDSCSTIMAFSINFGVSMGVLAALVLIPSLQV